MDNGNGAKQVDQKPQEAKPYVMVVFGLFAMLMGAVVFLSAADIFPSDDADFNAPRWVVGMVGLMFFLAGIQISSMDISFAGVQDKWWFKMLQRVLQIVWVAMFAAAINWAAFGPGERQFSSSISLPFITISKSVSGVSIGRLAFGIGAMLTNLIFLWMVVDLFKISWKEWSEPDQMADEDDAAL